ncbi:MAG TPA: T9SS type A sorting domain-containing protein [Bacteroidales bacterium]|nr:T9SS type A sorting domain-containing protein [Bacteroidales bacterium]
MSEQANTSRTKSFPVGYMEHSTKPLSMSYRSFLFLFFLNYVVVSSIAAQSSSTFQSFSVGFKPAGMKVVDLNQDEIPDVAVISPASDTLFALLYGVGDGSFQTPIVLRKEYNYGLFDMADINNDSYPDLLISGYWHNGFRLLKGSTGNNFTFVADYNMGGHATTVMYNDINNDGIQDVIGITSGSANPVTLHIYNGDNTGNLRKTDTFPTLLSGNNGMFVTDKNGDHLKDIVVSTRSWLAIFYQQADSSFKLKYWPVYGATSVVADINKDNSPDLILGFSDFESTDPQDSILVHLGEADTMFNLKPLKITFPGLRPGAMTIADIDNDSYPDLIVSHYNMSGETTDSLFLFKGLGNEGFRYVKIIRLPGAVHHILVSDLNKDVFPEIVATTANDVVVVYNNGGLLTGIKPMYENYNVNIYLNPASGTIYIDPPEACSEVRITDIYGNTKLVKPGFDHSPMNIESLPAGVYFLQGYTNKKRIFSKKVIKL